MDAPGTTIGDLLLASGPEPGAGAGVGDELAPVPEPAPEPEADPDPEADAEAEADESGPRGRGNMGADLELRDEDCWEELGPGSGRGTTGSDVGAGEDDAPPGPTGVGFDDSGDDDGELSGSG